MRARKIKEITFDTEEVLLIRRAETATSAWCEACREVVQMVRPERAAAMCGTTAREIYRRVERGQLHYMESPDGSAWICSNSL